MSILKQFDQIEHKNITQVIFMNSKHGVDPGIYELHGTLNELEQPFNIINIYNQHLLSKELIQAISSSNSPTQLLQLFEQKLYLSINFFWTTCITFIQVDSNHGIDECHVCQKSKASHGNKNRTVLNSTIEDTISKWMSTKNVKLNFWYDSYTDIPDDKYLSDTRFTLIDIRSTNFILVNLDENIPLYLKIDYAKNHIIIHQMENSTTDYVCIMDLDITNTFSEIFTQESIDLIDIFGYVLVSRKTKTEFLAKYENGFIMTKTNDSNIIRSFKHIQESLLTLFLNTQFQNEEKYDDKVQIMWNTYPLLNKLIYLNKYPDSKWTNSYTDEEPGCTTNCKWSIDNLYEFNVNHDKYLLIANTNVVYDSCFLLKIKSFSQKYNLDIFKNKIVGIGTLGNTITLDIPLSRFDAINNIKIAFF